MWKKYARSGQATDNSIIRRMRLACWITKATNTHSEYVILIALPRHQWFRERASILRNTHIACLVEIYDLFYFTKFRRSVCSSPHWKPLQVTSTMQQNPFCVLVFQLVKKFLAQSGTRKFITAFTRAHCLSQSRGVLVLFTLLPRPISLKSTK